MALASASKRSVAVNVTVNAGINLMGSKNAIVLGAATKGPQALASNDAESERSSPTRTEGSALGKKRGAEEPIESDQNVEKKVRIEGKSKEATGA